MKRVSSTLQLCGVHLPNFVENPLQVATLPWLKVYLNHIPDIRKMVLQMPTWRSIRPPLRCEAFVMLRRRINNIKPLQWRDNSMSKKRDCLSL